MALSVLRHHCFEGGSGWLVAYRPPEEPGKMMPVHGALVVKYTFPVFLCCFTWLCKSPEPHRPPGSRFWKIFWVVEAGVLPPSSLRSLAGHGGPVLSGPDEVLFVPSQAFLNPGWPCADQAFVEGALCPVVDRFSNWEVISCDCK